MTQTLRFNRLVWLFVLGMIGFGFFGQSGLAWMGCPGTPQTDERRLWDEGLIKKRPAAKKPAKTARPNYQGGKTLRPTGISPGTPTQFQQFLGLTLWRLRPSQSGDQARVVVLGTGTQKRVELTPERVGVDGVFKEGEYVRVTIESPQTGYLYVIDREQYADGSVSDPYLIFPTVRLRGGDHQVTAGRIIEIPAQEDSPPYLTVQQNRPDHVGESLTVIVSPNPLPVTIGRNAVKLSAEQVADWERQWAAPFTRVDQEGGQGKTWTKAEQEAGKQPQRLLNQTEPVPQSIYCVATKPGDPVLIKLALKFAAKR